MRSLLSEGQLRYETVEKTVEGLRARLIDKAGLTGLIATTTAHSLDAETETRVLTLEVNENANHVREALRTIAARLGKVNIVPEELTAALNWLELAGDTTVSISYARWLADKVPVDRVAPRLTRDFRALISVIEACTVLHRSQRDRDSDGNIVATEADYAMAVASVGHAFELASNDTITKRQREAVNAVIFVIR